MNAPTNPLRLFTRDQVVEKVKAGKYGRYYFKTFNGSWVQVGQEYVLRYFSSSIRTENEYELDALKEKNAGYGLYITPLEPTEVEAPQVTVLEKSDVDPTV